MKIKFQIVILLLIICCCILIITNPNEAKYISWLENKHGISCNYDGINKTCQQIVGTDVETIDRRSRASTHLMIYSTSREYYQRANGELIEIKALGILNTYFNL